MSLLTVLTVPDPRLRETCTAVRLLDARIKKQADDLLETMYKANGIGLAAPQTGILERMLVLDIAAREEGERSAPHCLINPEVVWSSPERRIYKEGCLSLPDQFSDVERPSEIRVRYQTPGGKDTELHATGLLATCILHEMDHLNGTLFVDHISRVKRDMILRKLAKLKRAEG